MLMCFPRGVEPVEEVKQRMRLEVDQLFALVCINGHVEVARLDPEHRLLILINKQHTFLIDIDFYHFY